MINIIMQFQPNLLIGRKHTGTSRNQRLGRHPPADYTCYRAADYPMDP